MSTESLPKARTKIQISDREDWTADAKSMLPLSFQGHK